LLIGNEVLAQEKPISYEFQTGFTLSTTKDKLNLSKWGVGMYSKGLIDFRITPNFSIATGLGYRYEQFDSKYGTTINTNEGYVFYESGVGNMQRHWLDVPILFKGHFKLNSDNKLEVFSGPNLSIFTGGKIKDLKTGEIYKIKPDKFSDRIDYGLSMGVGYIIKERWSMNVNYNIGLRKEPPVNELSSTTRSLSLGAGYRF